LVKPGLHGRVEAPGRVGAERLGPLAERVIDVERLEVPPADRQGDELRLAVGDEELPQALDQQLVGDVAEVAQREGYAERLTPSARSGRAGTAGGGVAPPSGRDSDVSLMGAGPEEESDGAPVGRSASSASRSRKTTR